MDIKEDWLQWFTSFFDKKSSGGEPNQSQSIKPEPESIKPEPNYKLENELHRQIIRKFRRRKVYSFFRYNIWGVDLADMQSLSKYSKGIKYLLCAIDLISKYACVVPLKDKRGIIIENTFQKI